MADNRTIPFASNGSKAFIWTAFKYHKTMLLVVPNLRTAVVVPCSAQTGQENLVVLFFVIYFATNKCFNYLRTPF